MESKRQKLNTTGYTFFTVRYLLLFQRDDARGNAVFVKLKQADGARQAESLRACAAGIEEQRAAPVL